jgi:hypothetical protein
MLSDGITFLNITTEPGDTPLKIIYRKIPQVTVANGNCSDIL